MRGFSFFLAGVCLLLFSAFSTTFQGNSPADFYAALRSNNPTEIDQQISKIGKTSTQQNAMKGALLMKRAGFNQGAQEKIKLFKEGRDLLEQAMQKENKPEFHFMRLIIQEHAPAFLKYNQNIKEDVKIISSSYNQFPEQLKAEVNAYASTSKHLKPEDLQ